MKTSGLQTVFFVLSFTLSGQVLAEASARDAGEKPNFLILLTDDQGLDDFGWDGNHPYLETPRLDQLRNQSVHFSNHHVCPVCAPTRASLLTGRHAWRTGVTVVGYGWSYIKLDEVLFSEVLKQNGYQTGVWGKWHCGIDDGYYPWDRGFDETYMTEMYHYENNYGFVGSKANRVQHSKYSMDVMADYAIDFMKRNQDKPFCAYVPFITPHSKYVEIPGYFEKYKAKGLSDVNAKFFGTVEKFDTALGRILDSMEELGLANNTVVIFGTDNGPNPSNEKEKISESDWGVRNPSKLRGNKANTWENGIRTPWYVRWKGRFSPKEIRTSTHVTDIFPTIVELAGIDYTSEKKQDGRSLVPLLEDSPSNPERLTELGNRYVVSTHQAVNFRGRQNKNLPFPPDYRNSVRFVDQSLVCHNGRFKLILNPLKFMPFSFSPSPGMDAGGYALFDLQNDPSETKNVIQDYPQVANRMKRAMRTWFDDVVDDENFGKRPEFVIGYQQKPSAQVSVRCAQLVGGGFSNVSPRMKDTGDFGEFNLIVQTPGVWEASLMHMRAATDGKVRVSVGDQSYTVTPTGTSTKVGPFEFPNENEHLTLRIEVDAVAANGRPVINRLNSIRFDQLRR
ncbi:MAG: sulfatase-like hydrolase/transferase [Planctomycetota bacterium]